MDKIQHILYINLERREDRKLSVESELKKAGFTNFNRFNAFDIKENPRLGCSTSHLKCLQYAKEKNWDMVMIVEDDIIFDNVEIFQKQLEMFLNSFTVMSIPVSSLILDLKPNLEILDISNSFLFTPSGFVLSHFIIPLYPTFLAIFIASSLTDKS